jgi:hypothetical protein
LSLSSIEIREKIRIKTVSTQTTSLIGIPNTHDSLLNVRSERMPYDNSRQHSAQKYHRHKLELFLRPHLDTSKEFDQSLAGCDTRNADAERHRSAPADLDQFPLPKAERFARHADKEKRNSIPSCSDDGRTNLVQRIHSE